jgi:RNA-binding protein
MNDSGSLLGFQKQYLKSLAHPLKPVVQVGKDGLTEAVVTQTRQALLAHELIKVRLSRPTDKKGLAAELARACLATFWELIGHTVILYKPHPDEPEIKLPAR